VLQVQRTANNAAHRVTGMDVIAHTQALADREMEHASSTQRDHVSRETRRQRCHQPNQQVSARSTAHRPFSHSVCRRVPLRDRVARQKRGSASGLPSVAIRRAARLLQGDAGVGGFRRAGHESALIVSMGQCHQRGRRRAT